MIPRAGIENVEPETIALVGIPYDENSSFMRGAAEAPSRIRKILFNGSSNLCAENGIDLSDESRLKDIGDLEINGEVPYYEIIDHVISELCGQGAYVLSLGGDHSITYPIIKAYRDF